MYMLDTNICIYVLKSHSERLRRRFKAAKSICISSITYGELCFGIENGDKSLINTRWEQLDLFTQRLYIAPWEEGAAREIGMIKAGLKRRGSLIGNNDLLIAAHARSLRTVLVTNSVREFNRIPGVTIENWVEETI